MDRLYFHKILARFIHDLQNLLIAWVSKNYFPKFIRSLIDDTQGSVAEPISMSTPQMSLVFKCVRVVTTKDNEGDKEAR